MDISNPITRRKKKSNKKKKLDQENTGKGTQRDSTCHLREKRKSPNLNKKVKKMTHKKNWICLTKCRMKMQQR